MNFHRIRFNGNQLTESPFVSTEGLFTYRHSSVLPLIPRIIVAVSIQYPKMENLADLTIDELVEILSTQTSLYVLMHTEGASEKEFHRCRSMLQAVQAEIKSRKEIKSKQAK